MDRLLAPLLIAVLSAHVHSQQRLGPPRKIPEEALALSALCQHVQVLLATLQHHTFDLAGYLDLMGSSQHTPSLSQPRAFGGSRDEEPS